MGAGVPDLYLDLSLWSTNPGPITASVPVAGNFSLTLVGNSETFTVTNPGTFAYSAGIATLLGLGMLGLIAFRWGRGRLLPS